MIELKDITVSFGEGPLRRVILDGVSHSFERGSLSVIFGPSGSGKSTFLHVIAGLQEVDSGTVLVGGREPSGQSGNLVRKQMGYAFQSPLLISDMRAGDYCTMIGRLAGRTREDTEPLVHEIMTALGMGDQFREWIWKMSGGERQRLALVATLARDPKVLLLDEPTGSLDPGATGTVFRFLEEWNSTHDVTTVIVTHDPEGRTLGDPFELRDGTIVPR